MLIKIFLFNYKIKIYDMKIKNNHSVSIIFVSPYLALSNANLNYIQFVINKLQLTFLFHICGIRLIINQLNLFLFKVNGQQKCRNA